MLIISVRLSWTTTESYMEDTARMQKFKDNPFIGKKQNRIKLEVYTHLVPVHVAKNCCSNLSKDDQREENGKLKKKN